VFSRVPTLPPLPFPELLNEPISPIKKTFRAIERDRQDVLEKKAAYLDATENISPEKLVFIDETGSNLNMERTHARSRKGHRAFCKRSARRHENISVIGAVSLDGFKHVYPFACSVNEDLFLMYLDELLPKLSHDQVVVMDNVRFHHCDAVKARFKAAKIRLIYLPPYHPELNPIEEAWSCVKGTLRSLRARTIPDYLKALQQGIANVTKSKLEGFFRHAGYLAQLA